jgi:hypothetical protein
MGSLASQKLNRRKVSIDAGEKQHAIIEFLLLERSSAEEIAVRLQKVYSEAAYWRSTVFRWMNTIHNENYELQANRNRSSGLETK